jgi:hypothetical protein
MCFQPLAWCIDDYRPPRRPLNQPRVPADYWSPLPLKSFLRARRVTYLAALSAGALRGRYLSRLRSSTRKAPVESKRGRMSTCQPYATLHPSACLVKLNVLYTFLHAAHRTSISWQSWPRPVGKPIFDSKVLGRSQEYVREHTRVLCPESI